MTPSEAARSAGVPLSTLRYYERRGFIAPRREGSSGHRRFTEDDVRRVRFIQRAQRLGFGMGDVAAFFALADGQTVPTADLRTVIDAKLADLDERIADLVRMREALTALAQGTEDGTCDCPVVEALGDERAEPEAVATREGEPEAVSVRVESAPAR